MKTFITFAIASMIASTSMAQEQFSVATGDSKGGSTYSAMYRQLAARCPNVGTLERETTGSIQNMELLTGNQVNAAVVQTDFLFYMRSTDEFKVTNIKTLFALHPEELHFIARADVKQEGGVFGIGSKKVSYNTVTDLRNRPIGAVGGSVLSAKVFGGQSGLNFQVVEFPSNDAMKAALLAGKVDAILVVGGAPHKLVGSLDQNYRLLSVDQGTALKVGAVYTGTKLSYTNLGQSGIPSVATQALMVTRTYKSPTVLKQLAAYRQCFEAQVPEIQDQTGTHPKWQVVDTTNHGKWTSYYELPNK